MKYLRYMGEFLSRAGVTWRAEILQENDAAFTNIGPLVFEANEPLSIDWGNESKEMVLCGSTATLQIVSPGDRTYEDLYSIEPGRIRLDVYRAGRLYWSGALDTEFYEEPYEQANGYAVSLTFSDFGVLDRLKYELSGMLTIHSVISYCIGRTNINTNGIDDSIISTSLTSSGAAIELSSINVRSDNFFDEDGEALTLAEVIEGVLQPLALRMIQRNGKVYIYDLHALYTKATTQQIKWDGASSNMGVDVVYNNAKITWNTYAQSGNLAPENCWGDIETPASLTALNNTSGGSSGSARYYSYHYSASLWDWIDATDCGFTIWITREGNNATLVADTVNFFKIVPQYDGTESEGIAIYWQSVRGYKYGGGGNWSAGMQTQGNGTANGALMGTLASCGPALFKSVPVWVPPVDTPNKLLMRVTIDMLMDPRFNPFESAANLMKGVEQKDWYTQWGQRGNYVYVPVTIKYQPEGSDTIYCWTNTSIVSRDKNSPVTTLAETYGSWVTYTNDANPNVWGYLAYYDAKDRAETSGVLGWKKNRPAINPHTKGTISILTNAEPGQYIPYPNFGGAGGKIWVEVRGGSWQISDGNANLSSTTIQNPFSLWGKYSWLLMKLPEIEIMNSSQFDQTIDTADIEYSAELNEAAKEPLEIDTICGTSADGVPTARGAYFNASTGAQIKALTRAGRTTQAEDLLIGTLYSQFAQRHTTLSGEVEIPIGELANYTESNQGDKKFMIVADTQNIIEDTSDTTFIELSPDEYNSIKKTK